MILVKIKALLLIWFKLRLKNIRDHHVRMYTWLLFLCKKFSLLSSCFQIGMLLLCLILIRLVFFFCIETETSIQIEWLSKFSWDATVFVNDGRLNFMLCYLISHSSLFCLPYVLCASEILCLLYYLTLVRNWWVSRRKTPVVRYRLPVIII